MLFQALLFSSPLAASVGVLGPSLYVVSTTLVLMSLVVNLRQPGFWLIALGAFLNFAAIVTNGGFMPASADAVAAWQGVAALPTTDYTNSAIATGATTLSFLGDIFVLPRPLPLANIFSIGDLLIGVGGAWFVIAAMHGRAVPATAKVAPLTSTTTRRNLDDLGTPVECLTPSALASPRSSTSCARPSVPTRGSLFLDDGDGTLQYAASVGNEKSSAGILDQVARPQLQRSRRSDADDAPGRSIGRDGRAHSTRWLGVHAARSRRCSAVRARTLATKAMVDVVGHRGQVGLDTPARNASSALRRA